MSMPRLYLHHVCIIKSLLFEHYSISSFTQVLFLFTMCLSGPPLNTTKHTSAPTHPPTHAPSPPHLLVIQ